MEWEKYEVGLNAQVGDVFAAEPPVSESQFSVMDDIMHSDPVRIDYRRLDEFQLRAQLKDFATCVDFEVVEALAKYNADRVLGRMCVRDVIPAAVEGEEK